MSRAAWMSLVSIALGGCSPQPIYPSQGILDDTGETTIKEIIVFPGRLPVAVLFGRPDAFICRGKNERAKEIGAGLSDAVASEDGYSYLDVTNDVTSYRAYFKVNDLTSGADAHYIFCSGAGSSLDAKNCGLIGVSPQGCYEAHIPGADALVEYDQTRIAIQANWRQ